MKKKSLSLMLISLLVSTEALIMPAAQAFASVDTTDILPCSCDDDRHKDNCEKEKKETKKDKKDCEKDKKDVEKDKKDCEKDKKDMEKDQKKEACPDMKFWTEDNMKLLNSDQKKKLCEIQEKIKKGNTLDESDKKALFELRDVVFKCKLGDKKYEEFKKLIEKKKCGDKLTEDEEEKLKCYFKELK
ncbi:MAG: hypothetical protein SPJ74_06680 [Bacilli bacterium]|nr:hypothetical protein [Bacilli bacterium]